jgi:hypothetical protein
MYNTGVQKCRFTNNTDTQNAAMFEAESEEHSTEL